MNYKKQLEKYIKETQKSGFSVAEITKALVDAGWKKDQIDSAFEGVAKKRSKFFENIAILFKKPEKKEFKKAGGVKKGMEIAPYHHPDLMAIVKKAEKKPEPVKKEVQKMPIIAKKEPIKKDEGVAKGKELMLYEKHDILAVGAKKYKKVEYKKEGPKFDKKAFFAKLNKVLFAVLLFFPKIILRILREIKEILRDDVLFVKNASKKIARRSIIEFELVKKEKDIAREDLHLFWHYIINFIEYLFGFVEKSALAIIKILMTPFAVVSILFSKFIKKKIDSEAPKPVGEKAKYDSVAVSKMQFLEHISVTDILRLSRRMFETRRLRTFLTILGMGVGIGAILFLVSLGYGLQNVLFERITTEDALLTLDAYTPTDAVINLDDEMIKKIESFNGVSKVGKMANVDGGISIGDVSVVSTINILDENFKSMIGERFVAGDFDGTDGVVISAAAARLLNFDDPKKAIGNDVSIFLLVPNPEQKDLVNTVNIEKKYKLVGVTEDAVNSLAYFPIEEIKNTKLPNYSQIKIRAENSDMINPLKEQIVSLGLQVAAISDTLEQAKKIFGIARIILGIFGIVTLIVSAIGMLNTMTIALLERTQEVGIMKSIGASNLDVWKLFLSESMIMGFLGGLGGVAMGYGVSEAVKYGINLLAKAFGGQALNLFQQPVWFVVTIVVFSAVIGFVTGLMPAMRAARLDPLMALKGQ
ncbi:ABC transporter permease [Candidatus Azambacteria bacterium]|nr:ABC transporter permease [Candidatus Azambacteria bacterium]